MIVDAMGDVDYDESGTGTALVFVPGSCSTGAAWRPIISALGSGHRCVTTSLLGYGRTSERRTCEDPDIRHEAEMLESVVRKAGGSVHLVGHSFGGLVALAVALRGNLSLESLTILEAPATEILLDANDEASHRDFRRMTDAYIREFSSGNAEAIAAMVDFYGGAGTFATWPPRVRAYAVETTAVNILDWATAYGFPLSASALAQINIPVLVVRGVESHRAVQRANGLVAKSIRNAKLVTLEAARHFMIATHATELAPLIAAHVRDAQHEGEKTYAAGDCA